MAPSGSPGCTNVRFTAATSRLMICPTTEAAATESPARQRGGSSQPSRTVVVVEDDVGMRTAIARLLRVAGFESLAFGSAESLLATTAADSAGCLILDVRLPGLTGFELYDRLTTAGSTPPVIFISAHDEAAGRAQADRVSAIAYLSKPFPGRSLLDAVARALDRRG
jgi:FixJ family two-component response regulator